MSFADFIPEKEKIFSIYHNATEDKVLRVLGKKRISPLDIPLLLSKPAEKHIKLMAEISHNRTVKKFGKTILLYIPLYVSNECVNNCVYCGFSVKNKFHRVTSTFSELEEQMKIIQKTGMRHILLVSGEAPKKVTVSYLEEAVRLAKKYFPSVSVEIYPMKSEDYRRLVESGAEGLVLYQETYDKEVYRKVHLGGMKRNFKKRLDAVEEGARAGFRKIGLGSLLGLNHYVFETTCLALHIEYLKKKYFDIFYTVSFPRLRESDVHYVPPYPVTDKQFVMMMLALRLVFDDIGIVVSTREPAKFRDNLIPLAPTQYSAGSKTEPNGYLKPDSELKQFEIEDNRSPQEVAASILRAGYEPVFKDWDRTIL